ncbi:helix-turn-helix domain-containing protein [Lacipirellula limnantheis]|uniref:Resolvase/invertase-type recombinase catalytic domain-containing protein n=1 Tax=Lacipirellula limnantheis TaxID=2528024 RepID=A0A517U5V4_9BACT|nr:helix-turn-helix domain-containing protein [Lacipirellula limnantheis]QDT76009.1 hypothetical protein I41_52540 [Lacipirellula limnantheis]
MEAEPLTPIQRRLAAKYPDSPPGIASHFLHALADREPCPYVLHARVSSLSQGYRKNLPPQVSVVRDAALERGFRLIEVVEEEGPGWRTEWGFDRYLLERSIAMAREHNGIVLFESTDRAIRPYGYNGRINPGQQPTKFEFELLMQLTDGVPLVTVYDPDMDWREVKSRQTRRGQEGKNARGGRPVKTQPGDKKRRRGLLEPRARRLHELGYSKADLAAMLGIPESTLRNWIREWRN